MQPASIWEKSGRLSVMGQEMFRLISEFTGQPVERVVADSDRDRWFTAQEALDYGFVDHIITRAEVNGSGPGAGLKK